MIIEESLRRISSEPHEDFYQVLTPEGELLIPIDGMIDNSLAVGMYRHMVYARTFDRKCISLQRQGRMGTYAPFEGQEAAQIGSVLALSDDDWMFPSYREHAATVTRGQPLQTVIRYWKGRLDGGVGYREKHILPPSVPIATHLLHAVGAAWASRIRHEAAVSIAYFGDGATSEGDFHESLNFAGVNRLPVIFLCQNNGYAISVPFNKQSSSRTIAQRASAYDIEGIRVDGNDVFGVYMAVSEARKRALEGQGPTLVEAVTFRYGAHTTADDPKKYRDQEELLAKWRKRDPIHRLRRFLEREDLWDERQESQLAADCTEQIDQAISEVLSLPPEQPEAMFEHVYAEAPWHIAEQREELNRILRKDGMQS
ncbi:pyruvate dehydrogenase (acetyl-transferring) E1 component subunit alpha [Alicyclobacillus dauci]|uniref:Pyruvate dehydrogenase E1 component subunit alpha n=1 Tax=Alicyclobacillus dauci TaxID=1475485 RepID=A0ABY6Z8L0_9BACL|nr:pyruvate dehydrogenase (acetyl-transferring) E1 component subunit alpha [Alicyclobacillus dauci]WAH39211.1 pyruvate dehydrogenase (acetyl-transferring) E1 component subunit alpha [Alicyclobacillus dauci]